MTLKQLIEKGGHGFEISENKIALIRCPECKRENYALNVLSGLCTWCDFDANKEPPCAQ
jgi:hypothetical protein